MVLGYRHRLILTYFVVVFVSLLVIGVYLAKSMEGYLTKQIDSEIKRNTLLVSELVRRNFEEQNDALSVDALADDLGRCIGLRVSVLSPTGVMLGDSEKDPASMENHASRPEVIQALETGVGMDVRYSTTLGVRLRYVAISVTSGDNVLCIVRLAIPLSQVEESIRVIRKFIINASILAILMAFVLSVVLARNIGTPLRNMADAALEMARGDFRRRIRTKNADELGQLADAFNHMAVELEQSIGELSERKDRMETILSGMADGVIATDSSGKIFLVNRAASEMFDISEEDARGKYVLEAIRGHDLAKSLQSARNNQSNTCEIELREPRPLSLRVHSAPIIEAGKGNVSGAVAVLQDVTDLRRLERMRTEFVSNVSHELRTPVTSIKGFVDTLLDGALEDKRTLYRFLQIISRETDRLAQIISDLLELSRLESKGTQVKKKPVVLSDVANQALSIIEDKAKAKNIRININIEPDSPQVAADEALIIQVFVNLLDNAVKFTPEGGHVQVTSSNEGDITRVDVSDTGIGIVPEYLPRVFERFYRVDKARSRQLGGTGLGLSIVKHIIERHGGTVSVSSTPGKGSTFSFTLTSYRQAN